MNEYFDCSTGIGSKTDALIGHCGRFKDGCFDWDTGVGSRTNILIGALGSVQGRVF